MFLVVRMENTFARLGRVKGTPVIFAKYATLAVQESTMVRCGGGVASTFTLAAPPTLHPSSSQPPVLHSRFQPLPFIDNPATTAQ